MELLVYYYGSITEQETSAVVRNGWQVQNNIWCKNSTLDLQRSLQLWFQGMSLLHYLQPRLSLRTPAQTVIGKCFSKCWSNQGAGQMEGEQ